MKAAVAPACGGRVSLGLGRGVEGADEEDVGVGIKHYGHFWGSWFE